MSLWRVAWEQGFEWCELPVPCSERVLWYKEVFQLSVWPKADAETRSVYDHMCPLWKNWYASTSLWGHSCFRNVCDSPGGKSGFPLKGVNRPGCEESLKGHIVFLKAIREASRMVSTRGVCVMEYVWVNSLRWPRLSQACGLTDHVIGCDSGHMVKSSVGSQSWLQNGTLQRVHN